MSGDSKPLTRCSSSRILRLSSRKKEKAICKCAKSKVLMSTKSKLPVLE